jgi:hypothetical protein
VVFGTEFDVRFDPNPRSKREGDVRCPHEVGKEDLGLGTAGNRWKSRISGNRTLYQSCCRADNDDSNV